MAGSLSSFVGNANTTGLALRGSGKVTDVKLKEFGVVAESTPVSTTMGIPELRTKVSENAMVCTISVVWPVSVSLARSS